MSRSHGILFAAVAAALGGALSFTGALAQPSSRATPAVFTGTICRIDAGTGTLELLVGVGHAIRLEPIRFHASCPVKSRSKSATVSSLAPGVVCRVECSLVDSHETATAVEVLTPSGVRP